MVQPDHHKIVLLESNQSRRDHLRSLIAGWGYQPFIFEKESICIDNLLPLNPDLVISGTMDTEQTLHFIQSLQFIKQNLPVLVLSTDEAVRDFAVSNGFTHIEVLQAGASPSAIKSAIHRNLESSQKTSKHATAPLIIGSGPAMTQAKTLIPKLNHSRAPILIQGEPGVGKELFARAIHSHSNRNGHPFTKINAVKLPYLLLEGELFGYPIERVELSLIRDGKGMLASTDKGTLFIKEIADLPVSLQAKMLRVFEDESDLGGSDRGDIPADVRIIASTTQNLAHLVRAGKFRSDLFYRLNVYSVFMPTLRERTEDIPSLADFFAYQFCFEYGRSYFQLSPKTKQTLCRYLWPGNVKELSDVIRQAVICGDPDCIALYIEAKETETQVGYRNRRKTDLPLANGLLDLKAYLQKTENYTLRSVRREFMARTEKILIKRALEAANWNRKKAAEILDISYKSLLNKVKQFGLV